MLTASHQYTGQNRVGICSTFGAIAAIRFPDDHPWPQLALGQVIGFDYSTNILRRGSTCSPTAARADLRQQDTALFW